MALDFPDAPVVGQVYGSSGTSWKWDGERWASTSAGLWPRGTVAYAAVTANQAAPNSLTNITGTLVTLNLAAGRRYKITGEIQAYSSVAGDAGMLQLSAAAGIQSQTVYYPMANLQQKFHIELVFTAPTNVVGAAYVLQYARTVGTGAHTIFAQPTMPSFILVEDITYDPTPVHETAPTPWTQCSLINGWLAYAPAPPMYRKVGDVVYFRGYLTAPPTINASPFTVMPVGFRIAGGLQEFICSGYSGGRTKGTIGVDAAGNVTVYDGFAASSNPSLAQLYYSVTP